MREAAYPLQTGPKQRARNAWGLSSALRNTGTPIMALFILDKDATPTRNSPRPVRDHRSYRGWRNGGGVSGPRHDTEPGGRYQSAT